jgi:hypothetical protein
MALHPTACNPAILVAFGKSLLASQRMWGPLAFCIRLLTYLAFSLLYIKCSRGLAGLHEVLRDKPPSEPRNLSINPPPYPKPARPRQQPPRPLAGILCRFRCAWPEDGLTIGLLLALKMGCLCKN